MRHFPCQPLPEFSVFLYAAFRFRGRKRKLKYMSSLHKSPPMSASYLKRTVSKAWRQIHFFFFLPLPLLLSKTAWLRDKFPSSQERKKKSETEALLNEQLRGPSGLWSLSILQGWAVEAELSSSAPAAARVCPKMCGAGEREIFRGTSVCCRA